MCRFYGPEKSSGCDFFISPNWLFLLKKAGWLGNLETNQIPTDSKKHLKINANSDH
jgi:hypothetical protein